MRRARAVSSILLALILFAGSALAQDASTPDTVRVGKVTTNAGLDVGVPISCFNDNDIAGYSIGVKWNSTDITFDSVSYIGTRLPGTANKPLNDDYLAEQKLLVGFADFTSENPLAPGTGLLVTMWFSVAGAAPDQFITFDTSFVPPAGDFQFAPVVGDGFVPIYVAGEIKIGNPQPPPIINLSQGTFTFNGLVGQGNPPSQLQTISNGGGQTLNWTATKQSTWLVITPTLGTAPTPMVVSVNTASLGAGTYKDTVTVSAAGATNTPQKFVVTLVMTVPPPTIQVIPDSLYFQGLQSAANPPDQGIAINNIGQGTLNWTATENAVWLSLSAYTGTAPSNVSVSINTTGLLAGVYRDSIRISDPTATNSPRRVKVVLEIFSAFPVIDHTPDTVMAVGNETQNPYDRILYIENDGGGEMNWSLTKKNPWLTLSSTSGTTVQGSPSPVTLSFNRNLVDFGQHFDTVKITSSNATNSPQNVKVIFWKAEVPQNLLVTTNALSFTEVECGSYPGVASQAFNVSRAEVAPPLNWSLTYKAPWLTVTPTGSANPALVTVKVKVAGLAPGVYKDTIVISSDVAIDPPKKVVVTFNVLPTPINPTLDLSRDSLIYIYKYTQLGSASQTVQIFGQTGGCVDWTATADVPWLTPIPATGTTLDSIVVRSDPVGLNLGRHTGNLIINSSTAGNTPFNFPVVVWIYTFGDANGNGIVNISDVVYIMNYIFSGGPAPVPLFITGDVNCDRVITISDCVYLLNWIFSEGPYPCLY